MSGIEQEYKEIRKQYDLAKSGLIPVTRDLINELRMQKMGLEAEQLLTAFRKNNYKQRLIEREEVRKMLTKKERIKRKNLGVCIQCGIRESLDNNTRCKRCYTMIINSKSKQKGYKKK